DVQSNSGNEFVTVYTDGSCTKPEVSLPQAGAGICWGLECRRNMALRVPGRQTSNRAELFAALIAVSNADPDRPLRLYTDSQNTIRMCCHWAASYAMTGWNCANRDLLIPLVWALKRRRTVTRMEWVKGHSGNALNDEADRLAK
ncbi:ribonuclease H-like protein, partial [Exidia glandulosa HHB12029]